MRQNNTKQLLEYWLTLFRECNVSENSPVFPQWPDRRSVQPSHCRSLLSEMFILESHGGPFHYRLAGTNLCALYGRELKREEFSQAFIAPDQDAAEDWISRLTLDEQVVLICSVAQLDSGERINLETLLLPLSNSTGSGRRVLGITVPHDAGNMMQKEGISAQAIRSVRVLHPWKKTSKSNRADHNFVKQPNLAADNGRFDTLAPPLSPKNDKFFTTIEPNDLNHKYKRVGHLLVIDGGRGQEAPQE